MVSPENIESLDSEEKKNNQHLSRECNFTIKEYGQHS
jgi:hypothetical protein